MAPAPIGACAFALALVVPNATVGAQWVCGLVVVASIDLRSSGGAARDTLAPAPCRASASARAFGAHYASVRSLNVLGLVKSALRVAGQEHESIASR